MRIWKNTFLRKINDNGDDDHDDHDDHDHDDDDDDDDDENHVSDILTTKTLPNLSAPATVS